MWCPRCHTEVAAEIAQNGQALNCTSCGTEIQRIYAPSLHPDTRSARELLERWSKSDLLDAVPGSSHPEIIEAPAPAVLPAAASTVPESAPPAVVVPLMAASTAQAIEVPVVPAEISSTAATEAEQEAASSRRDRPERTRPERPTPKPRTTWRVDAAHSVTQPAAPLPPPVPPRRPYFSAVVGETETAHEEQVTPRTLAPSAANRSVPDEPASYETPEPEPVGANSQERSDSTATVDISSGGIEEPKLPLRGAVRAAAAAPFVQRRVDSAHEALGGPHFDLQAFLAQDSRKPGRSESIWGQVLAYAGVGLITVGTTMVLWAWFGNNPKYAPTGWLICTVGQMLLFLGVITLVSGGIQQTSHEVTRRVEYLGDRILRFEHTAEQAMRAPHFHENRDRSKSKSHATTAQTDHDDEFEA